MEWGNGLRGLHINHSGIWDDDAHATFRCEGTLGVAKGTIGVFYNYPHGREDTLSYTSKRYGDAWFDAKLEGQWIPDAFVGPMAELFAAIQEGREPSPNGVDNLHTLALVEACYRSLTEHRAVRLAEFPLAGV